MSIYQPYTYLLTHKATGKRYYGARYTNSSRAVANPSDLWVSYFTSSKVVRGMVARDGIESFAVEVRRTFDTAEEARAWEHKVLRRLKVLTKEQWINRGFFKTFDNKGRRLTHKTKTLIREFMIGRDHRSGKPHSEATKALISANRKGKYKITEDHMIKLNAARCIKAKIIYPDGREEITENLNQFCLDKGLDRSHMSKVANGRLKHHKKFRCSYV